MRRAAATRALLMCGVAAGPLYLLVSFAQAFTRAGFDITRHPFSALSLGDLGWIQIANFVVAGVLFIFAAVGMRRVLGGERGGTLGPLLIGVMGLGMIIAGVCVADPAFGFPPGAPDGMPSAFTWHAQVHGNAFMVAFVAWIAACFVFARRFAAAGVWSWVAYCAATGLLLAAAPLLLSSSVGVLTLYVAATLGWIWIAALSGRLLAETLTIVSPS